MDNLSVRRAIATAVAALSGLPQNVSNVFNMNAGEVYEPPIGSGAGNYEVNRLSQKARRKRAKWTR